MKEKNVETETPVVPPFKMGDVVQLKSGGFKMTVVSVGFSRTCSPSDKGRWLVETMYAPDRPDYGGIEYEEFDAIFLKLAPDAVADELIPF